MTAQPHTFASGYQHWIEPGTYVGHTALEQRVEPSPHDPFKAGDRVRCIITWHPASGEYRGQEHGEEFTVRAYLRDYDYLILEESEHGYVNGYRFTPLPWKDPR